MTHTFVGRNEGDEPLVIEVMPPAAAAGPHSRAETAVPPGRRDARIIVTFTPATGRGASSKELGLSSRRSGWRGSASRQRQAPRTPKRERSGSISARVCWLTELHSSSPTSSQRHPTEVAWLTDEPMTRARTRQIADGFPTFTARASWPRRTLPDRHKLPRTDRQPPIRHGAGRGKPCNGRAGRTLTPTSGIAVDPPQTDGPAPRMQETIIRFGTQRRQRGCRLSPRGSPIRHANACPAVESQARHLLPLAAKEWVAPQTPEATVTPDPGSLDTALYVETPAIVTNDPEHPADAARDGHHRTNHYRIHVPDTRKKRTRRGALPLMRSCPASRCRTVRHRPHDESRRAHIASPSPTTTPRALGDHRHASSASPRAAFARSGRATALADFAGLLDALDLYTRSPAALRYVRVFLRRRRGVRPGLSAGRRLHNTSRGRRDNRRQDPRHADLHRAWAARRPLLHRHRRRQPGSQRARDGSDCAPLDAGERYDECVAIGQMIMMKFVP